MMPIKLGKIALIFSVSLAVILAGELFVRFALGLGTPPLTIKHPTIEYMFRPGQDVYRFGNHILINQYGMRSEDFPAKYSGSDEIRVMVFGDSVLNGGSQIGHENLATTLLSQQIAQSQNRQVTVGNISAGSWGPGNWLAYAKEYGFFDANIVLLVLSSDDYADNPSFAPLNLNTHPVRRPKSALTEALSRYLPMFWNKWVVRRNENHDESQAATQKASSEDIEQGLQDLKDFLTLARTESQTVIVFLHLEKQELELGQFKEGHYKIIELCEQLGISAISSEPFYRESISRGINIYRDEIHTTEAGQKVLADAIFSSLKGPVLRNKKLINDRQGG
ncbi:hypothetical protein C7293_02140 [filamentous cyanobacterium CCT1]|nr:hypothetical protein C7293_02140 [filamentous cyanobacterium CCT1]PSN80451.1 hypothetical protein C8B47_06380 [filamentous cyanobacterium CCP4]